LQDISNDSAMDSPQLREQNMMNEEPTPRKSDIIEVNRRNSSVNANQGAGKTFDLRKSIDSGSNDSGRQVAIFEPN